MTVTEWQLGLCEMAYTGNSDWTAMWKFCLSNTWFCLIMLQMRLSSGWQNPLSLN